jgi:hypothetical protein
VISISGVQYKPYLKAAVTAPVADQFYFYIASRDNAGAADKQCWCTVPYATVTNGTKQGTEGTMNILCPKKILYHLKAVKTTQAFF